MVAEALKLELKAALRAARAEKKGIDFDSSSCDKQIEALVAFVRGGHSETELDEILQTAMRKQRVLSEQNVPYL